MIGKQCATSDGQVVRLSMGLQMLCADPSRFCSKVLSQKVKLPFTWNDAIHLCQCWAQHTLMLCFASTEFAQIHEESCCATSAELNVAVQPDFTVHEARSLIYCLILKETEIDMGKSWENKINLAGISGREI